ncbi:hypothetical protein AN401_00370 [Zobellella denitrificans]|uniref:Uncharacterized protein n=1 Tax=Zobellella denitrificans TaxID=347534 RepID=A0A291HK36_9GAMM|nr:hypothetical protein [Zobellella denitrificans]ATG72485.1 hypothetical protein AN401_00370 [Zobellella denitrificans]
MNASQATIGHLGAHLAEQGRELRRLEGGGGRLLTLFSLLLVAQGLLTAFNATLLFHPAGPLGWIALALCLLAFFTLACGWGHALLSFRPPEQAPAPPLEAELDALLHGDDPASLERLQTEYRQLGRKLDQAIALKRRFFNHACDELAISAWLLALFGLLLVFGL